MMTRSTSWLRVLLLSVALSFPLTAGSAPALAQAEVAEELDDADARLRGYESRSVYLQDSGTTLTYFALIGLTVLAVGLLFKSSRRTHLD